MATFTVTTEADTLDAADGRLSLREAVEAANATDEADRIVFAPDLEGQTLFLEAGQLEVAHDLAIDGDHDDDGTGVTVNGNLNGRVFLIGGQGTQAELDDLRIAQGNVLDSHGGGILLGAGNALTLDGCALLENGALLEGATNVNGGAVYAESGSRLVVRDSVLGGNFCYGVGGAIATAAGVAVTVRDSELTQNAAYHSGGAIALTRGSRLVMERSSASANDAGNFYFGGGGALAIHDSSAVVRASSFGVNQARQYGGAIDVRDGTLTLEHSTIASNVVQGRNGLGAGGGIVARYGSEVTLTNATVTGNFASYYSAYGIGEVGGGIASDGVLRLANSIVAGNFSGYAGLLSPGRLADDVSGAISASNGRNLFGSTVEGAVAGDLEDVDPARIFAGLDPATGGGVLALFGGPTASVALRDALDNPALGAADPMLAGTRDQRGFARPSAEAGLPDLGAFELDETRVSTRAGAGNDRLIGTPRADTILAGSGSDLVRGLAGDDELHGEAGGDLVAGGAGDDRLQGGNGADILFGGPGDDLVEGGEGDDRLEGDAGQDHLIGGGGDDLLIGGVGDDGIDGGAGSRDVASWCRDDGPAGQGVTADLDRGIAVRASETDTLLGLEGLRGTDWDDRLRGGDGDDRLFGAGGNDELDGRAGDDLLDGGPGDDRLDGGIGTDLASFRTGGRVSVDLDAGWARRADATDRLLGIEGALGSAFADRLRGDEGANSLDGGAGDDHLQGGLGADLLTGGPGRDRFVYDSVAESPAGADHDVITDFTWGFEAFVDRIDLAGIDADAGTAADDAFRFIDAEPFTAAGQVRWRSLPEGTLIQANTGGSLAPDLEIELADRFIVDATSFIL